MKEKANKQISKLSSLLQKPSQLSQKRSQSTQQFNRTKSQSQKKQQQFDHDRQDAESNKQSSQSPLFKSTIHMNTGIKNFVLKDKEEYNQFSNTTMGFSKQFQDTFHLFNASETSLWNMAQGNNKLKQHILPNQINSAQSVKKSLSYNSNILPKKNDDGLELKVFKNAILPGVFSFSKQPCEVIKKDIYFIQDNKYNLLNCNNMSFVYFCISVKNKPSPQRLMAKNKFQFKLFRSETTHFPSKFNCDATYSTNSIYHYSPNRLNFHNDYLYYAFLNELNCETILVKCNFGLPAKKEEELIKIDMMQSHKNRLMNQLPCELIQFNQLQQDISKLIKFILNQIYQHQQKQKYESFYKHTQNTNKEQIKNKRFKLLMQRNGCSYIDRVELNRSNAFEQFRQDERQKVKFIQIAQRKIKMHQVQDRKQMIDEQFLEHKMQATNNRAMAKIIVQAHKFVFAKQNFKRSWMKVWILALYMSIMQQELFKFMQRKIKYKRRKVWLMLQLKCSLKTNLRKLKQKGETLDLRIMFDIGSILRIKYNQFTISQLKRSSGRVVADFLQKSIDLDSSGMLAVKCIRRYRMFQKLWFAYKQKTMYFRQLIGRVWDNNFIAIYMDIKSREIEQIRQIDESLGIKHATQGEDEILSPHNIRKRGRTITRYARMGTLQENSQFKQIKKMNNQVLKNFYVSDYLDLSRLIYQNNMRKHQALFNQLSNFDQRLIKLTRLFIHHHTCMEEFILRLEDQQEEEYELEKPVLSFVIPQEQELKEEIKEEVGKFQYPFLDPSRKPINKLLERVRQNAIFKASAVVARDASEDNNTNNAININNIQIQNFKNDKSKQNTPSHSRKVSVSQSQIQSRRGSIQVQVDKKVLDQVHVSEADDRYIPNPFEPPNLFVLPNYAQLKQMIARMLLKAQPLEEEQKIPANEESEQLKSTKTVPVLKQPRAGNVKTQKKRLQVKIS